MTIPPLDPAVGCSCSDCSKPLIEYNKPFIAWNKSNDPPLVSETNKFPLIVPPRQLKEVNAQEPQHFLKFDYSKLKENQIFGKLYTGKFLAYKILSNSVPKMIIPADTLEIDLFFKSNFTDNPEDVFRRYCKYHDLDVDETIDLYRSTLKWELIIKENKEKDLTKEMENLTDIFFRFM